MKWQNQEKIIELRDKQARDTNSRCVWCGVYKMDRRGWLVVFGPCVEGRQTARVKKNKKRFKTIARFEISSKRRLAMRKRVKSEPVPNIQLFRNNSA